MPLTIPKPRSPSNKPSDNNSTISLSDPDSYSHLETQEPEQTKAGKRRRRRRKNRARKRSMDEHWSSLALKEGPLEEGKKDEAAGVQLHISADHQTRVAQYVPLQIRTVSRWLIICWCTSDFKETERVLEWLREIPDDAAGGFAIPTTPSRVSIPKDAQAPKDELTNRLDDCCAAILQRLERLQKDLFAIIDRITGKGDLGGECMCGEVVSGSTVDEKSGQDGDDEYSDESLSYW